LTEPGLFPTNEVEKFAARLVLFVCTGNTCRSPLAEALARKKLAERLGCDPEGLPARGVWVLSAGVAAHGGGPASEESAAADDVIAMTDAHAQALATRYPGVGPAPRLLCGDADLDDPIGASLDVYRACARTILTHLERFLPEWTGK